MSLHRHTLVWIKQSERAELYGRTAHELRRDALRRWFANDWPFVVRRSEDALRSGQVQLGLPLPPSEGKHRLSFQADERAIARFTPPLLLDETALRLPERWRRPLLALARQTSASGATLRVYGSAAWQALTGLAYLHADSDVDLLFEPDSSAQLEAVLRAVAHWEKRSRMRADGEVLFPCRSAVSWREWNVARDDERVLVKRTTAAGLAVRGELAHALNVSAPWRNA